jgi:MFS family permease
MSEVCVEASNLEVKQYLGRNYLLHSLEGGFIIGGMTFVSAETVLPRLVEFLNGPAWLISLMPVMLALGFCLPPVFTAHKVENLNRMKPFIMATSIFQRVPFLLAGIVLLLLVEKSSSLALLAIVVAPFVAGLAGGLGMTAWQELIIKTIPENRRASLFAIRMILSAGFGIAAGGIISQILNQYPGIKGYGILYVIAFGFMMLSYVAFALVRETQYSPRPVKHAVSLKQNLREMPGLVRNNRRFQIYLWTLAAMNGLYVMLPFLTIHALRVLQKPDSFMGILVTTQMVGGIAGNILTGYLGDRFGGKTSMIFSRVVFIITCFWAALSPDYLSFIIIFFLYGAALFSNAVGTATFNLEICPPARRVTYLAIVALSGAFSLLILSLTGGFLWTWTASFPLLAGISIFFMLLSTVLLLKIPEPRRERTSARVASVATTGN